jgi:hypothetical protein
MCVSIHRIRHIKVDDVGDMSYVNTSSSDVCRDQKVDFPSPEASHRPLALVLRHIALKSCHTEALAAQVAGQVASPVLSAGENKYPPGSCLVEQRQQ